MKKLLLITTAATILSANAYAGYSPGCGPVTAGCGTDRISPVTCDTGCATTSPCGFYGTASIGIERFLRAGKRPYKLRPRSVSPIGQLGVGYCLNDMFNAELVGILTRSRFRTRGVDTTIPGISVPYGSRTKATNYGLMIKLLGRLPIMEDYGVYAGPGFGWSRNKTTTNFYTDGFSYQGVNYPGSENRLRSKSKSSFMWGFFLGGDMPIIDSLKTHVELSYIAWGRNKYRNDSGASVKGNRYKAIGLSVGVRHHF